MTEKFLVAFDTLVTGLTVCALSVTCGDSSPKGRAKSTAGSFLVSPSTLATNVMAFLSERTCVLVSKKAKKAAGRSCFQKCPAAGCIRFYSTLPVTVFPL